MRQCFECGLSTDSTYCPQDGLITFQPEQAPEPCELSQDRVLDGRYRVGRRLGRGGMGLVYEAVQVRTGGPLALKVLHVPEQARRFYHEARATSRLAPHPNLIQVFDFGQTEEGIFYMAMERLVGESVAERLHQRARLPETEALEILLQLLEGLEHAHSGGLLHRDLKAQNLFLHRLRPGREITKILDFGIVKTAGVALTQDGIMMGTPEYMAPERCLEGRESDVRSDLYAVGVILYELLAGAPPFSAASIGEVLRMQVQKPAPDLRERVPEVSAGLGEVVARALRKDPAERFQDARAMRRALEEAHQARVSEGRARGLFTGILPTLPPVQGPASPTARAAPAPPPAGLPRRLRSLAAGASAARRRISLAGAAAALLILCGVLLQVYQGRRQLRRCEEGGGDPAVRLAACQRSCEGGTRPDLCARLGDLLQGQDARAAGVAYGKACAGGVLRGCAAQGGLLVRQRPAPDVNQAALLLVRACEGGEAGACEDLAALHAGVLVPGVPPDEFLATTLYQRACAGERAAACLVAGQRYDAGRGAPRDRVQAAGLYQRACQARLPEACYHLGALYEGGRGVPRDEAHAAALYQQACSGGEAIGCSHLGDLYLEGRGVRRDRAQGVELMRQGCRAGHSWACNYLREL